MSWCLVVLLLAPTCLALGPPLPMRKAQVNLNTTPEQRWTQLFHDTVTTYGYNYTYKPVVDYITSKVPADLLKLIEAESALLEKDLQNDFMMEIRGLAQAADELGYGKELPLAFFVTLNLIYEYTSACTSIVSMDKNETTWHSRNMDWSFDGNSLRNISLLVDFVQDGNTVFQAVTWLGYVGTPTGLHPSGFSITADATVGGSIFDIPTALNRIRKREAQCIGFTIRDVLQFNKTFDEAVASLSQHPITTPAYFIVGGAGKGQGSVVTRNESSVAEDIWSIPNGPKPWYVIETNYYHGANPPPFDDRRRLAEGALNAVGQDNVSPDSLMRVMETPSDGKSRGVLNTETQYTIITSPTTNYIKVVTWQ
eukprot:m.89169 g.89169  ORF g.89169 m.89169 type:complete len:367 (+) comp21503_c0_seq1:1-1101(+)